MQCTNMYPAAFTPRQAYSPGRYSMYPAGTPSGSSNVCARKPSFAFDSIQRCFPIRPGCVQLLIPQQGMLSKFDPSIAIRVGPAVSPAIWSVLLGNNLVGDLVVSCLRNHFLR